MSGRGFDRAQNLYCYKQGHLWLSFSPEYNWGHWSILSTLWSENLPKEDYSPEIWRQMKILKTSKAVSFIEGPSPSCLALQPQIWAQGPPTAAFSNKLLQRRPQLRLTCPRSYPPQGIPHPENGQARPCWPAVAPGQVQQASSSPDSPTSLSCVAVCLLPWSSPAPSHFTDISP